MIRGNSNEESALLMDQYLPVIEKCDVLIVGGGFAGVSAARKFAKNGASLVLIERRIYLGREMTSTCRPWINHANGSRNEIPELVKIGIDPKFDQPFADKTLFRYSKIKKSLKNDLLASDNTIVSGQAFAYFTNKRIQNPEIQKDLSLNFWKYPRNLQNELINKYSGLEYINNEAYLILLEQYHKNLITAGDLRKIITSVHPENIRDEKVQNKLKTLLQDSNPFVRNLTMKLIED